MPDNVGFSPFANVKPFLPKTVVFGDRFGVIAYTTAFVKQAEMLWKADLAKLPDRVQMSRPLLYALREDVKALSALIAQGFPNQSYILYRAVIEKMVTFWHLQIAKAEVFEDYFQYPLHKMYRKSVNDVRVQSNSGEIGFRSKLTLDLSKFPEMERAVKRFTSRAGKPLTRWHDASLSNRIAEVKRSNIVDTALIELLDEQVYDDSSEALHGTLYGCLFHLDTYEFRPRAASPADMEQRICERLFSSSWLGALCMFQIVDWLLGQSGQKDLLESAREMDAAIKNHMERAVRNPLMDRSTSSSDKPTEPQE